MGAFFSFVAIIVASSAGATIPNAQVAKQDTEFRRYWGEDFVWKYDDLPTQAQVSAQRVPYSGYIYPDTAGGTSNALRKYDQAFNRGRYSATSYEQWDTTAYREPVQVQQQARRVGLFGRRFGGGTVTVMSTPYWYGHCNGWAAAAIRHAEPKQSVVRNGVTFTPADIKAMLAEIYMYNDNAELAGAGYSVNAGELHAILANWLGRGAHPIAMEADPGKEKWNYPIYGYATTFGRRSSREVEVKLNIAYAKDSRGEFQESPRIPYKKYFHYMLTLNDAGDIVGGYYFRDSAVIDLLWVPLCPTPGGSETNKRGNPHVDVDQVLAIWRESVPEELRQNWVIVDPPKQDKLVGLANFETLVPVQGDADQEADPPEAAPAAAPPEEDDATVATAGG